MAHGLHGLTSLPAREHVEEESLIAGGSATTPGMRERLWDNLSDRIRIRLEIRSYNNIITQIATSVQSQSRYSVLNVVL